MNAALFRTTFWHVVWVTEGRKRLFASFDIRRSAERRVRELAEQKHIRAHQATAQDDHFHVLFELPDGMDERAGELFAGIKNDLELFFGATNPNLPRVWDSRNFFERVELGAFGAVRDYVKEQERHHAQAV